MPATLATLPHRLPTARRDELGPESVERALEMIRLLMGDAEEMVQKALSWAIREWTRVDAEPLRRCCGQRLPSRSSTETVPVPGSSAIHSPARRPTSAPTCADQLASLRRDREAPSTSIAAGQAASFAALLAGANDAVAAQGDRYTRSRA